ncbi:MAG: hypothetical protein J6Y37_18455 [Paludibacteraceae bacterium]|nr:hypothetical protein [Paludibacteraceae bacterium]
MNKIIYQFLLFAIFSLTCNAQDAPNGKPDFDFYIINLIKADWTINCSTLRYVNSHDENTMYIVDVKDKYHRFIEKICKQQHKDTICLLTREDNYCAVYKPYEADYKMYDKLLKKSICLIPYSMVQPLLDEQKRVIVKSKLSDERFDELYKTYGIVYVEKKGKEKKSNR